MNKLEPLNEKQTEYIKRCTHSWFNVAEGGKRGGKNVVNTLAWCITLEEHKSKFHLAAGVSNYSAKQNILECDGLGLLNYFSGRCKTGKHNDRDCVFIQTKAGNKIIYVAGGGKEGSAKGIKGSTYGTVYITEANECAQSFLKEANDRTIASSNAKIFHDLNPFAEGHWYYTDMLSVHEKKQKENPDYGYNYEHFTIADNLSVSDEMLKERIARYDKTSVWYMRDIKGLRVQATGLVYPNWRQCIVDTVDRKYTRYMVSCDYGIQNATVFQLWGICEGVWYMVDEYYHSGREENEQYDDDMYYTALDRFCGNLNVDTIIIDPSAASFKAKIFNVGRFGVMDADNDVLNGIRNTYTAIRRGIIKVNDCCTHMIHEFGLYSWKDNDNGEDEVIKEDDHMNDGLRYFVQTNNLINQHRASLLD